MIEILTLLILLIPFSVFIFNSIVLRNLISDKSEIPGIVNSISIGISFIFALIVLFNVGDFSSSISFTWINLNDVDITFSFLVDPLTAIMLVVVSGVAFLVQI